MNQQAEKKRLRLGFGLMRLPKNAMGAPDLKQVCTMADRFLAEGGTYFDTAFVYDGGLSEAAFKYAVADRYPREAYTLATKLHAASAQCTDEKSARQQLFTSLERTGAGYIDCYLLHALQRSNYRKYEDYGLWDFVQEQKSAGLIRHVGFSFHADPMLLEELLNSHPEVEFVQLQINYADWDNPGVSSRRNWEICREHGKPVVIMEPVKGGILADPVPEVKRVLSAVGSSLSWPGWALRFALSLPNVAMVLSGMSSPEQMEDNLRAAQMDGPLSPEEEKAFAAAARAFAGDPSIPCTGCRYCVEGCPKHIPIPDIFTVLNRRDGSPCFRTVREYNIVTQNRGRASQCVGCGQCEKACPQHLPIVDLLRREGVPLETP